MNADQDGPPTEVVAAGIATAEEPALSFAERARAREGSADLLVFRVGGELFALVLTSIEEALELPQLSAIPEMSSSMLGVVTLHDLLRAQMAYGKALGQD